MLPLDRYRRTCGAVLSFREDGVGRVGDREFGWLIGDEGQVVIEMGDGSGSIILHKQASHRDGSLSLLARTFEGDNQSVRHTQAVKRDRQAAAAAIDGGVLINVPLEELISATNPYNKLGPDGRSVEGTGLLLSPDGSGLRYENLDSTNPITDWIDLGEPSRFSRHLGVWSVEGNSLSIIYCYRGASPANSQIAIPIRTPLRSSPTPTFSATLRLSLQ